MSQAIMLRLQALEARVAELEQRRQGIAKTSEEVYEALEAFRPKHFGFGKDRWQVIDRNDAKVGTEWLTREAAASLADELNASLEGTEH